jgi:hypothetical protein
MSPALRTAVKAVAEGQWKPYGKPDTEVIRECADVLFVPNEQSERKDLQPLRYVAVRIRRRQGGLLEEEAEDRHFAVLTNIREWNASRLLGWHRGKAGTIEAVHDVLKNELAAGVLPCGRFGANAAWLPALHAVLAGDPDAQCTDGAETPGAAGGTVAGPAQTAALSVLQYGWTAGASRAAHDPAPGQQYHKAGAISGSAALTAPARVRFLIDGFAELFWHDSGETAPKSQLSLPDTPQPPRPDSTLVTWPRRYLTTFVLTAAITLINGLGIY